MIGLFKRLYGKGPMHLVGHVVVIAITAFVLSVLFEKTFAPRPWNLALWLLGGAVLHDVVFLPIWGVLNALLARIVGASDERPLSELAMGTAPGEAVAERAAAESGSTFGLARDRGLAAGRVLPASRDQQRRVPIINYVRVPIAISVVIFIVYAPRILDRQPQNFVNALGHAPPDFFMRWVWFTVGVVLLSALLYAARWVRAGAVSGLATPDR